MCRFSVLGAQTETDRTPAFSNPRDQAEKIDVSRSLETGTEDQQGLPGAEL